MSDGNWGVRLRNQAKSAEQPAIQLIVLPFCDKGHVDGLQCRSATPIYAQDDDEQLLFVRSIGKRRFEHVADRLPGTAIELNQSHLLDWSEILRTRVDLDAGQEPGGLIVPQ